MSRRMKMPDVKEWRQQIGDGICGGIDSFFVYKTNKFLWVDIWQLGLFYRVLQLGILGYVIYGLIADNSWAYAEQPLGSFNMYVSGGSSSSKLGAATAGFGYTNPNGFVYCANGNYSYEYSAEYKYGTPPLCRELNTGEATVKGTSDFFFVTMFDERHTIGWTDPAQGGDPAIAAAQKQKCDDVATSFGTTCTLSDPPLPTDDCHIRDTQVKCYIREAFYPVAVENMAMAMELSYYTSDMFGGYKGSTNNAKDDPEKGRALEVRLYDSKGTNVMSAKNGGRGAIGDMKDGVVVDELTYWIAWELGELMSYMDLSLDQRNFELTPDYQTGAYPMFRTSGLSVSMDIDFVNNDPLLEKEARVDEIPLSLPAMVKPYDIRAEITMKPDTKSWAGLGPIMSYEQFPTGPRGETFHKVERYRQGVVFDFRTVGHVLKFDINVLIVQLAVAAGMLMLAGLITETLGYYLLVDGVTRTILKNKAKEKVTARSEFAELGMKAAIAATQYNLFDPDCNKLIEVGDIAKAFAKVEGVSPEKAYALSKLVMEGADTDFQLKEHTFKKLGNQIKKLAGKKTRASLGAATNEGLSYAEFITCLEGDAVGFTQFINGIKVPNDLDPKILQDIKAEFAKYTAKDATSETAMGLPEPKLAA